MQDVLAVQKAAIETNDEIVNILRHNIHDHLRLGKFLKEMRDAQLFKALGDGGYQTFESYLMQEVKMSRSYALRHIQVFEYFVLEMGYQLEELVDFRNLETMSTAIAVINRYALQGEQARGIIEKAKVLSLGDFKREVLSMSGLSEEQIDEEMNQQPQPQIPAETGAVVEEEDLRNEYLKPATKRCDFCHKWQIEYYENQVCLCSGKPHVLNLNQEGEGS